MGKPPSQKSSTFFMLTLYPAVPVWICFLGVSLALGLWNWALQGVCDSEEITPLWQDLSRPPISSECETVEEGEDCINCIDLYQFHFIFPAETRKEDMWLCGKEIVDFCSADLPAVSCRGWMHAKLKLNNFLVGNMRSLGS